MRLLALLLRLGLEFSTTEVQDGISFPLGCSSATRYPPEDYLDTGFKSTEVYSSQLATTLGVQDLSTVLSLFQGEILSTKTTSLVDMTQLERIVSQKQN